MVKLAFITLSSEGVKLFAHLKKTFPKADYFVHESVTEEVSDGRFKNVVGLTAEVFGNYEGILFISPCGVAVRAISGNLRHKTTDPAVVQMDVGGRYAVSLLSGHEGGANDLAIAVANAVGADPVISTSTEAVKNIIVGVGCRKGKEAEKIVEAIKSSLDEASTSIEKVRFIASADVKMEEEGLISAARMMDVPLRFIPSDEIRNSTREFQRSEFVDKSVGLPAVAEPTALLAGRRTTLILPKRKYDGITVAISKENSLSLE
jgi:cobalt-precorrin 5A hydrolase